MCYHVSETRAPKISSCAIEGRCDQIDQRRWPAEAARCKPQGDGAFLRTTLCRGTCVRRRLTLSASFLAYPARGLTTTLSRDPGGKNGQDVVRNNLTNALDAYMDMYTSLLSFYGVKAE